MGRTYRHTVWIIHILIPKTLDSLNRIAYYVQFGIKFCCQMTFQCHAYALHVLLNVVPAGSVASGAALTVNAKLQTKGAGM